MIKFMTSLKLKRCLYCGCLFLIMIFLAGCGSSKPTEESIIPQKTETKPEADESEPTTADEETEPELSELSYIPFANLSGEGESMPFSDLDADDILNIDFYYSIPISVEGGGYGTFIYSPAYNEIKEYVDILKRLKVTGKDTSPLDGCPIRDSQPGSVMIYLTDGRACSITLFAYENDPDNPYGPYELHIDNHILDADEELLREMDKFDQHIQETYKPK